MDKKARVVMITAIIIIGILLVSLALAKPTRAKKECADSIDNDGDGAIDLADTGCDNKFDNDETDCGDDVCEGGETCDTCVADCLGVGEVCCNGVAYSGDCCDNNDCTLPATCVNYYCTIADSCSDTDYGNYIYQQGTASGYLDEIYYQDTDYCVDGDTVYEYYCSGAYEQEGAYDCPLVNGTWVCSNGACVPE